MICVNLIVKRDLYPLRALSNFFNITGGDITELYLDNTFNE